MRMLILSLALGAALPAAAAEPAAAAAAKPALSRLVGGLRTWFEHLKEGLTESSVSAHQQKQVGVTAVAAVRGAAQSAPELDKPAWKSSVQSRRARLLQAQKEELSAAVELALQGKFDDADEKLVAFEKSHPNSAFLHEAKQARQRLKQAQGAPDAK